MAPPADGKGVPSLPSRGRGAGNTRKKVAIAAAAPAIAAAAWAWAVKRASAAPELFVGEGELKTRVLPWLSLLTNAFVPAPLALNTHAQNVLGFIRGASIIPRYTRQLIIAHDGGTLGLDWFAGCDASGYAAPDAPVLLVLHGINGGSHEGYCKWVCHEACRKGWRATVLNYRGCGGLPLTSPRGYAASLTHDIHFTITTIKARFPKAPVFAVGYSLGGVFLTKYLAEADNGLHASDAASRQPATHTPPPPTATAGAATTAAPPSAQPTPAPPPPAHPHPAPGPQQHVGDAGATAAVAGGQGAGQEAVHGGGGAGSEVQGEGGRSGEGEAGGEGGEGGTWEPWFQRGSGLVAAAVVSSPVCLSNSSASLSRPFTLNYLYNLALAFKLREFMRHHEKEIRGKHSALNLEAALSQWTVPAMEDEGIPRTFGFQNRAEYYEAVSSLGFIPHIKTPTLFLISKDDPFLGVLPDQECSHNPHTLLAATERGGHVAFLQGLWPLGPAYMDHAVLQFLDATWQHLPPPAPHAQPPGPTYHSPSTLHPHHHHLRQQQQQQRQQREQQGVVVGSGAEVADSAPRTWLQPEVLALAAVAPSFPITSSDVADVTTSSVVAGGEEGGAQGQSSHPYAPGVVIGEQAGQVAVVVLQSEGAGMGALSGGAAVQVEEAAPQEHMATAVAAAAAADTVAAVDAVVQEQRLAPQQLDREYTRASVSHASLVGLRSKL